MPNWNENQKNLFSEMLRITALAMAEQDEQKKIEYLRHATDQLRILNGAKVQISGPLH